MLLAAGARRAAAGAAARGGVRGLGSPAARDVYDVVIVGGSLVGAALACSLGTARAFFGSI